MKSIVACLLLSGLLAAPTLRAATGVDAAEARIVDAAEFGVVGNGRADDTATLQRALDSGKRVRLIPGHRYVVSSRLTIPSGGGIIGGGSAEILAKASGFTNDDPQPRAFFKNDSSVLYAGGMTQPPFTPAHDIAIRGIVLRFESTEGRVVDAIDIRNADNVLVDKMDISGFPVGVGIRLNSVGGDSAVRDNVIHDFSSNTNFLPRFPKSNAQITAIEVDNNRINQRGTRNLVIRGNRIDNIAVGPTFLAAQGYQTDGINVASDSAEGLVIENNEISRIGEGIDHWGVRSQIANNTVRQAYLFGIKLIHGARENDVHDNTVLKAGLAGMVLSGSPEGPHGTERNTLSRNVIRDIDPDGVFAKNETSCIQLSDNRGTTWKARGNIFVGNTCLPGKNGKWAVNRANNSGGGNDFSRNAFDAPGAHGLVSQGDRPN